MDRALITLSIFIVLIWFISHLGWKFNKFRRALKKKLFFLRASRFFSSDYKLLDKRTFFIFVSLDRAFISLSNCIFFIRFIPHLNRKFSEFIKIILFEAILNMKNRQINQIKQWLTMIPTAEYVIRLWLSLLMFPVIRKKEQSGTLSS